MTPEERNFDYIMQSIGNTELTADEIKSLRWLANWEAATVKNIISAVQKSVKSERPYSELNG